MEWKSEYGIGIARIDAQHRGIFECLLAIEKSKLQHDSREIQRYFFGQLVDALQRHFEAEETMLDAIGYPELESHAAYHLQLAEYLLNLEKRLLAAPTAADLVGFLEEWFIGHVLADDREYAAYLRRLAAAGGTASLETEADG